MVSGMGHYQTHHICYKIDILNLYDIYNNAIAPFVKTFVIFIGWKMTMQAKTSVQQLSPAKYICSRLHVVIFCLIKMI